MKLETISEYDLIGQEITITQSKNKEIIGIGGKVIMEKKNMITQIQIMEKRTSQKIFVNLVTTKGY